MAVARRRILVAVLVYNGRSFVPRALSSLARLRSDPDHDVEVVVFDDASPDPGWSAELADLCATLGLGCYRSPRNLGIPRNMSLALLHGERAQFDYTVILNSDVVVPRNMVSAMVAVAEADASIASVTAWSNNASIFSLPNDDAARYLSDGPTLDEVSDTLERAFGAEAVPIPTGVGFCMMIPRSAVGAVGTFDPVFGRGYCEEVDWCRRADDLGLRNVLAPSAFVYHIGSASTRLAGLLAPGEQTVHTHEDIVDQHHPNYRDDVAAWKLTGVMEATVDRALRALVQRAAGERGYVLEASWLHREPSADAATEPVRFIVNPDGDRPLVEAVSQGWRYAVPIEGAGVLDAVAGFVGCLPHQVRILDRGSQASRLSEDAARLGVPLRNLARYPERV